MESLITTLQSISPLSESDLGVITAHTSQLSLSKGERLDRASDADNAFIGILISGVMKQTLAYAEQERTSGIYKAGDFIGNYADMLSGRPEDAYMLAIIPCEVAVVPFKQLDPIFESSPALQTLGRRILERLHVQTEGRLRSLLVLSHEQRYLEFMDQYGEIAGKIPDYEIAAFLGISPVSLSRIRQRLHSRS